MNEIVRSLTRLFRSSLYSQCSARFCSLATKLMIVSPAVGLAARKACLAIGPFLFGGVGVGGVGLEIVGESVHGFRLVFLLPLLHWLGSSC